MLKNRIKFILVFLTCIIIALSFSASFATDSSPLLTTTQDEDILTIGTLNEESSNVLNDNYYAIGESELTVNQIIDGNAFIIGTDVRLNSEIKGDAFIIAKNLIIEDEGQIDNNLFVCASNITVKGKVNNVFSISEGMNINNSGFITKDLFSISQNLNILGSIGRNANISTENITFTDSLNHGKISGNLNYSSTSPLNISKEFVEGEINFHEATSDDTDDNSISSYINSLISALVCVAVVYLVCMWLAPNFINKSKEILSTKVGSSLGLGALTLICIPLIAIILLCMEFTIKVSFILLLLYILMLLIASSIFIVAASGICAEKFNLENQWHKFGVALALTCVIWVLKLIPIIGGLLSFVIFLFGLGILVNSVLPKKEKVTETAQ